MFEVMNRRNSATAVRLREAVRTLHPAYFAMVMSTGIISLAFWNLGMPGISHLFYVINVATYVILGSMLTIRLALYSRELLADLRHPARSWGFLTVVVGTNTLGVQLLVFGVTGLPAAAWVVALLLWCIFQYAIYSNLITRSGEPIEASVSGATLLTVVSTQSVAVLGSQLSNYVSGTGEALVVVSWLFWAAGFMLYLITIVLVAYRMLFREFRPSDWNGTYWICMGAVAITTLAGSNLTVRLSAIPVLSGFASATTVLTVLAWAVGTWWIPLQIYLDVWHFRRVDLVGPAPWWVRLFPWLRLALGHDTVHAYSPPQWGRVFPLGMYTAATLALARATGIEFLATIPRVTVWVALVAWVLTMVGTARAILHVR